MFHNIISFLLMMAIYFISSRVYKNNNNNFIRQNREKITSKKHFLYVYYYLKCSSVLIIFLSYFFPSSFLFIFHNIILLKYLGIVISILGVTLFLQGMKTLGENYSPCYDLHKPLYIVKTGVYKYLRHPLYIGNSIVMLGTFVSTGSFWMLLNTTILALYYYDSAIKERTNLKIFVERIKETNT